VAPVAHESQSLGSNGNLYIIKGKQRGRSGWYLGVALVIDRDLFT
jgi:hypothetical protein